MKDKTIKTIKGISIAVIILMTAVTVMDLYFWTERWQNVKWIDGHTGWQTSVIICYIISTLKLTAAVIYFIINIMKGLKKCIIFNRLNTSVIYASAIIFFVYSFMQTTVEDAFNGIYVWSINSNMLIGITAANLSILKTGKAKAVRFSTLAALCKALECQPGDILEYQPGEEDDTDE